MLNKKIKILVVAQMTSFKERIKLLKSVNNAVSRAIDFWITRTLDAFVTEFSIDTHTSFSEAERQFFKGPRAKVTSTSKVVCFATVKDTRGLLDPFP